MLVKNKREKEMSGDEDEDDKKEGKPEEEKKKDGEEPKIEEDGMYWFFFDVVSTHLVYCASIENPVCIIIEKAFKIPVYIQIY